ncbi:transposase, partial [Vagococcus teuberi]
MSFICADGKTGELVDILPSRTLNKLTVYFNRTPLEERKKVKFLVTDMNAAFNEFRVREMKVLIRQKKKSEANKLKSNWKFLLKNQQ